MFGTVAYSEPEMIEFDNNILESLGFDNVDLSAFSKSSNQGIVGEYVVDLQLNSEMISRGYPVLFYSNDDDDDVGVCFTDALIQKLALRKEYLPKTSQNEVVIEVDGQECRPFQAVDQSIHAEFNPRNQRLNLIIPQKYLGPIDPDWVTPAERDYGVAGVVLDYNLFWSHFRSNYSGFGRVSDTSLRSNGTAGFNIGRFRFRSDYQYNSSQKYGNKLDWTQTYAFTDIPSLNSKLYMGELSLRSNIFDNVRIKGISLYSDENMMPAYLKGYAPQVTGTAQTDAIVTIRQYGRVVRMLQVPPGPFVISDLPSYVNGLINVEIEESNGEVQTYDFEVASVPFLTRKGGMRYSLNAGKLDPYRKVEGLDAKVISGDISYGITNYLSIYSGGQALTNGEYLALNLGLGVNMGQFGAISLDYTRAKNKAIKTEEGANYRGNSFRVNYAKRFDDNIALNIAAYRFSSRQFTTLNNYITYKDAGFRDTLIEKNRLSVSLSYSIPEWNMGISGTLSKSSYWNRQGDSAYNITVNKTIRDGSFYGTMLSLSLSQTKNNLNTRSNQIGFYVTMPLDDLISSRGTATYSANYDSYAKDVTQSVRYSGYNRVGDNYALGINARNKRDFSGSIDYTVSGSYSKETGYGQLYLSGDYTKDRQSLRASFDGSLTLTQHGIATHKRVYGDESRLILDAGVPGVSLEGRDKEKSNIFGLMGVSNLTSYYHGTYRVDNDRLPDDVEIQNGVVNVAVATGTIAYRPLGGVTGDKAIAVITLSDGSYPPFGAVVLKEGEDNPLSIVSEDGLTYLVGINKRDLYFVKWGDFSCELNLKSLNSKDINNLLCN